VTADTAYDADHLRQAIAAKGALAVIPNNPSRALKYPLDKHLYAQRHRRMLLLKTQAIPPRRNPLRKDPP
jgi:transposase